MVGKIIKEKSLIVIPVLLQLLLITCLNRVKNLIRLTFIMFDLELTLNGTMKLIKNGR